MMKNVNLIQTLSREKQFEIRRWFWCSAILLFLTIATISIFSYLQLSAFYIAQKEVATLREKTKKYNDETENKNKLKSELETLQSKKNKINQFINAPKNPHAILTALTNACGTAITVVEMSLNNKNIELSALCESPEHATVFMQRLSTFKQFSHLKLVSLGLEQSNKFKITVKGPITFFNSTHA